LHPIGAQYFGAVAMGLFLKMFVRLNAALTKKQMRHPKIGWRISSAQ
jgi:hypothetical protein